MKNRPVRTCGIGFVIVCAVMFHAKNVFAQASADPSRFYVFADTGWGGYIVYQGSEFGGAMLGGGAGMAIGPDLSLEAVVEQNYYNRHDWAGWEGTVNTILGRAVYRFGRPVAPVRFSLSAAFGHATDSWHYPPLPYWENQSVALYEEREHFAVWGLGAGAHVRVRTRMFLRPEFGFLVGKSNAFYRSSITAGVRF